MLATKGFIPVGAKTNYSGGMLPTLAITNLAKYDMLRLKISGAGVDAKDLNAVILVEYTGSLVAPSPSPSPIASGL